MMVTMVEEVIEPEIPIIDPHHHLWMKSRAELEALDGADSVGTRFLADLFRARPRYLLDEFLTDLETGHDVRATVLVDGGAMYRRSGPDELRSLGEVEFANGVAAMAAGGAFGSVRVCAGIVGGVDLRIGDRVRNVLEAHIRAGGDRYRGVRVSGAHDGDATIFGAGSRPNLYAEPVFRAGFAQLAPLGLSFDAMIFEPQLPEVVALAQAFPGTPIIVNHLGSPLGVGRYAGREAEREPVWLASMRDLAACENVSLKLGGIGNPFSGSPLIGRTNASSATIAGEWGSRVRACIEIFGSDRCMFESNYPVDAGVASYVALWNAFKLMVADGSAAEKNALFSGTAARIYRIDV